MIDLPVEAGRKYYIEFKLKAGDDIKNNVHRLDLVRPSLALEESKKCKYEESHELQ